MKRILMTLCAALTLGAASAAGTTPALGDEKSLYDLLDLERPGMEAVKKAVAKGNTAAADKELLKYFLSTENYTKKSGKAMRGFMPDWIGEFYAYYQWFYNIPSREVVKKIPLSFLKKAYPGLHDLELDLAVQKVGEPE